MGNFKGMLRILTLLVGTTAMLSTPSVGANSGATEWWQDTFIQEGSGTCDSNDSIRTYQPKIMNGWELTCRIVKQQKLKDITAVILDFVCDGTDMDPQTLRYRELIVKEQNGIRIYPSNYEGGLYQSCSSLKIAEQPKSDDKPVNDPPKKREERLAITNNWYHREGKDPEGFTIFRKFTVDTSANIPNRNLLMLRCTKTGKPSDLTIFVPYRFDLPALYGQQRIPKKRFMFVVTNSDGQSHMFNMYAEVDQNLLYFDYSDDDKGNFDKLLNASNAILYLNDQNVPMQWLELGETKAWPSLADRNVKLDFDAWTKETLDIVGETTTLTNTDLLKYYPGLEMSN